MDKSSVSDAAAYQRAVTWLEDDEARRLGQPVRVVRPIVARQIGVAPGTLENVRKGRTKQLRGWVERRIDQALTRALERRIAGLTHELEAARLRGLASDCGVVERAATARNALEVILHGGPDRPRI